MARRNSVTCRLRLSDTSFSPGITVLGKPWTFPKLFSSLLTYVSSSSRPYSLHLPQLTQATSA
jgi:hypothetical protein